MSPDRKSSRTLLWGMLVTMVLLLGMLMFMMSQFQADLSRRDDARGALISATNENLRTVQCFAQNQAQWDAAVTGILQANLTDPTDQQTQAALDQLAEATNQLGLIRDQCLADAPGLIPSDTPGP